MKEDLISKLIEVFKEETENISNSLEGVLNFKFEEFFKKNNPQKGYHSIDALVVFKNFTLKFEYKINISMLVPRSTLEIRFIFENGKLPVEYSMYDILDVIDKNNFKLYTFPYVTSETKMKEILKYLLKEFENYNEDIIQLSEDIDKIKILENNVNTKIQMLLDEKVFESSDAFYLMHILELYYTIDISRFTLDCYLEYIKGNYTKAIKKYSKLGKKTTSYEKRLVEYMKNKEVAKPIEGNINTLLEAQKLKKAKYEFVPMIASWLILTPVWSVIYDIIFHIALYFLSKEAICVGVADSFMLFLPAFTTATIGSFFIRKSMCKLFFAKKYNEIMALDEIENSKKVKEKMTKIFQFVIALGLVFSVLLANTNITFYESYFKDNLELLNIKGETIEYTDIECVYKANGYNNSLGQVVDNPTYVIVLKDGKKINLSYNIENVDIENNVIPLFEKNGIEIREIDLVENI